MAGSRRTSARRSLASEKGEGPLGLHPRRKVAVRKLVPSQGLLVYSPNTSSYSGTGTVPSGVHNFEREP